MTNFDPKKLNKNWTIEDSISTYGIDKWGEKYFSINSDGNISISPNRKSKKKVDLFKLVKEFKSREINTPLIIRFNDILKDRITELNNAFCQAIETYNYKNIFCGTTVITLVESCVAVFFLPTCVRRIRKHVVTFLLKYIIIIIFLFLYLM